MAVERRKQLAEPWTVLARRFTVADNVNPTDARVYFREFRRVLKPGGRAVIHHSGPPPPGAGDDLRA